MPHVLKQIKLPANTLTWFRSSALSGEFREDSSCFLQPPDPLDLGQYSPEEHSLNNLTTLLGGSCASAADDRALQNSLESSRTSTYPNQLVLSSFYS